MNAFVMAIGAMVTKLLTGDNPKDARDLFFPRTGELDATGHEQRVALPSYAKDEYAYLHDLPNSVGETAGHKLHPLLATMWALAKNKDYFGTDIRDPESSVGQQIADTGKYVAKQFVPYSITGAQKLNESGAGAGKVALPFVGVTPAPSDTVKSKAELLASEYRRKFAPSGGHTQQEALKRQDRMANIDAIRKGGAPDFSKLKAGEATKLYKAAGMTPLESSFKTLPVDVAEKVYAAATPQEKTKLLPALTNKRMNAMKSGRSLVDIMDRVAK
jgi:hypothetical protein